ncbi:MAG TPA: DUF1540 domain-containing protein [Limnochordia bacterium]|nr:DUF1540 domain-containing protein [Limnochordia bacterium]
MSSKVEVYCTVDNCQWWSEGNHCHAAKILITSDAVGDAYPDEVDSPQVDMIVSEQGETPVDACRETCCKTFTPRA